MPQSEILPQKSCILILGNYLFDYHVAQKSSPAGFPS